MRKSPTPTVEIANKPPEKPSLPTPDSAKPSDVSEAAPAVLSKWIEAALITTDRPISSSKLAEIMTKDDTKIGAKAIGAVIVQLNEEYDTSGRTFRIEQVAGGWQIMTVPEYEPVLATMSKTRQQTRLSPAALETLAIIAYKQPILRSEIEAIRGVGCGEVLRSLMERHLVKIVARSEELGRPMLYGTTKTFMEMFGLASLKDLPKVEEFAMKH